MIVYSQTEFLLKMSLSLRFWGLSYELDEKFGSSLSILCENFQLYVWLETSVFPDKAFRIDYRPITNTFDLWESLQGATRIYEFLTEEFLRECEVIVYDIISRDTQDMYLTYK